MNLDLEAITQAGADLTYFCHGQAAENGWWTDMTTGQTLTSKGYPLIQPTVNVGEKLMLIVTEAGEAMDGHRRLLMDDKLPHRPMLEVELADIVIRCFDTSGGLGLDIAGAITEKLIFNSKREDHKIENRRAVGGKKV